MLPCVQDKGLGIFVPTADQRNLLGQEIFFRTHFPTEMKRYRSNGSSEMWGEQTLLQLINSSLERRISGNQTFVLFGAAGSGKSEVIRYLYNNLMTSDRNRFVLRISRTELDPVQIMYKILIQFNMPGLDPSILTQWEDLRRKPVTLANHLVWSALGKLLSSDEEIIPISYKLRPLVEQNLRTSFMGIENPTENQEQSIELISLEDLEEVTRQSSLYLDVSCEQLRFLMSRELDHAIMGGANFVSTLSSISKKVKELYGLRPVLLVDDLVQSLNLYASELMDYFITMEEGDWDIVIGLTPSSFETNKRGKELLNRINNLDSFDDRLIKLWMSDAQGLESFCLTENNCHSFAQGYLKEYKKINGWNCDEKCSYKTICKSLGDSNDTTLLPFNPPLLRRVYRSLPKSKGKPRYFVQAISDLLEYFAAGKVREALFRNVRSELAADHEDPIVRLIAENYAYELHETTDVLRLDGRLLDSLGLPNILGTSTCDVPITNLISKRNPDPVDENGPYEQVDPGKLAIKTWLEAEPVNKELLKGLRLGIAHIIREMIQPTEIKRANTSRQSATLKWDETIEGSRIPFSFEGVDEFDGIPVSIRLGHTAYQLNYIHLRRGVNKENAIKNILRNNELYRIMNQAQKYYYNIHGELANDLGMPINEFAFVLFYVLMELRQEIKEVPGPLFEQYKNTPRCYPSCIRNLQLALEKEEAQFVAEFFKDWFLLRENIYDGPIIHKLLKRYQNCDPFALIERLDTDNLRDQLKIGSLPLRKLISNIQLRIREIDNITRLVEANQPVQYFLTIKSLLMDMQHPINHDDIENTLIRAYKRLGLSSMNLPDWQQCSKLLAKLNKIAKKHCDSKGTLILDTTLQRHRFMLVLGNLENDLNYNLMLNLVKDLEGMKIRIDSEYQEYQRLGVACNVDTLLPTFNHNNDNPKVNNLYNLKQLELYLEKLEIEKQRLRIMEWAIQYANMALLNETSDIALKLKDSINFDMPEWIENRVKKLILECNDYRQAVDNFYNWELDPESYQQMASSLARLYKHLGEGGLTKQLLSLVNDIQSFLIKMNKILRTIVPKERETKGLDNEIFQLFTQKQSSTIGITNMLLKYLELTAKIMDTFRNDQLVAFQDRENLSLINTIFQKEVIDMDFSRQSVHQLETFINQYPRCNSLLKIRIQLPN